jgi:hypothetical protein
VVHPGFRVLLEQRRSKRKREREMGSLKEIVDKKQKKKRNKKANDSDFSERVSLGSNFPAFNSLPSFTFLLF